MNRRALLSLLLVCAAMCAATPAFCETSLPDLLGAMGFDTEWIRLFAQSWDTLQARLGLPPETARYVVGLLRREWLPEDAASAAAELHEAVREVEIQRRQGYPLRSIGTRLRHELERGGQRLSVAAEKGAKAAAGRGDRLAEWRRKRAGARGKADRPGGPGPGGSGNGGRSGKP